MLDIQVKEVPGAAVAYLRGEADSGTSAQLLQTLRHIMDSHPLQLVIVMDDLHYLDSRGLGALVGAYHHARTVQCGFSLVTSDPQVTRVIEITGLNTVMDVQRSESAALHIQA